MNLSRFLVTHFFFSAATESFRQEESSHDDSGLIRETGSVNFFSIHVEEEEWKIENAAAAHSALGIDVACVKRETFDLKFKFNLTLTYLKHCF